MPSSGGGYSAATHNPQASYQPVAPVFTIDDDDDDDNDDEDDGDQHDASHRQHHRAALEISGALDHDEDRGDDYGDGDDIDLGHVVAGPVEAIPLFSGRHPWLVTALITLFLVGPVLLAYIWFYYDFTGRVWPATPFALHLVGSFYFTQQLLRWRRLNSQGDHPAIAPKPFTSSWIYVACAIPDLAFVPYTMASKLLIGAFFRDLDGTDVLEWTEHKKQLERCQHVALAVVMLRLVVLLVMVLQRCLYDRTIPFLRLPAGAEGTTATMLASQQQDYVIRRVLYYAHIIGLWVGLVLAGWAMESLIVHFATLPPPRTQLRYGCDPLDDTECWLPFPSFHHMRPDPATATGWRVHLQGRLLPPLKGRMNMNPDFLNDLDGFSTMAPLLFYLDGLKEAHEAGAGQLQGHDHIGQSLTNRSITLLLNVDDRVLVPHSAEIDYLDPKHPLVMVFPASPLRHNTHYALAVVNAKNAQGQLLSPSLGMAQVITHFDDHLSSPSESTSFDLVRTRYRDSVIPALEQAANWFRFSRAPDSLQLLFDFQTVSESSQLGPVRAVRDAVLRVLDSTDWEWGMHVMTNRLLNHDCTDPSTVVARTIHADLDVPWFLTKFGPGHRGAVLDQEAVRLGQPTTVGMAKIVVYIPCSVRAAALNETGSSRPLRAVLEYGHGLFADRGEAADDFLLQLAHDEGYIITSMDWRGMSLYDLPIVLKTLMSRPSLFQAVRDNLIQGYANKYALQHFTKHYLLSMDWLQFPQDSHTDSSPSSSSDDDSDVQDEVLLVVPTLKSQAPVQAFYGISQGGILGAGYTALSGPTRLIDRGVLGVPGTPFALIMTRSLDFVGYDKLLLLNFYDNRHVRILLALVQMAWDSVEGAGVLAPPVHEPYPRMLMQAGLGDVIVPTVAAEALARALNASVLPHHPREIYGIAVARPASNGTDWLGPQVTLTELLYPNEYASLPKDNTFAKGNQIHICLRLDQKLIRQIAEFINTGRIVDPCEQDGCLRTEIKC